MSARNAYAAERPYGFVIGGERVAAPKAISIRIGSTRSSLWN